MSKERADWFCQDCRVPMLYDKKNDRHFCPACMVQVWHYDKDEPIPDNSEIAKLMREMYKANLPAKDPIPAGRAMSGRGGNKSSKRHGDREKLKRKTVGQLYKEL